MSVIADPQTEDYTHHLKLTKYDGTYRGLVLCDARGEPNPKGIQLISNPEHNVIAKPPGSRFDDRKPPYVAVEQNDWHGGSGMRDFERDHTRFRDSGFLWSPTPGRIYPAPLPKIATQSDRYITKKMPGDVSFLASAAANEYVAVKFSPSDTGTYNRLGAILRKIGTTDGTARISVYSDSAGSPGAEIEGAAIHQYDFFDSDTGPGVAGLSEFLEMWVANASLTAGTDYWLVLHLPIVDADNYYEVGVDDGAVDYTVKISSDGSSWSAPGSDWVPFFWVANYTYTNGTPHLFEYKRQMYCVLRFNNGTAPQLLMNGYRGVATGTQSQSTLQDTNQNWTVNELVGKVVYLSGGSSRDQFRRILSNTANTLTIADSFHRYWGKNPVTADTEYVILGCDNWEVISGHGMAAPAEGYEIGGPVVVDDYVAVPLGDGVNIRRFNAYNNAGTWTNRFEDDGTNKAKYLLVHRNDDGTKSLYRASVGGTSVIIAYGEVVDYGAGATSFGDDYDIGDASSPIRNLISYDGYVYVIKEDGLYAFRNDIADKVADFKIKSYYTGRAVTSMTPYLYFGFGAGYEQFFGKVLEDIGPDRDDGLVEMKHGYAQADEHIPGYTFLAINAGRTLLSDEDMRGWSTVHVYNGAGWHEIYRGPRVNQIKKLYYQSIPGLTGRLWIGHSWELWYQDFPEYAKEPILDSSMEYYWEGYIKTGWFDDNLLDIDKAWVTMTLYSENLDANTYVKAGFITDSGDEFTALADAFDDSPSEQHEIGTASTQTGKRSAYCLRLRTKDADVPPVVKSMVLDYIGKFPTGETYAVTFLLDHIEGETMLDAFGDEGEHTVTQVISFLRDAISDPRPLTMESIVEEFDNKTVIVQPMSLSVQEVTPGESRKMVGRMVLVETVL